MIFQRTDVWEAPAERSVQGSQLCLATLPVHTKHALFITVKEDAHD